MNYLRPLRTGISIRMHFSFSCLAIILFCLFCVPRLEAQKHFDFNPRCRQAYQEIIALKLGNGQALLDLEKSDHPDNLIPYLLENYIDFFVLYFNEDPLEYEARKPNLEKRLHLMSTGPESSPFFLFSKSVLHFQWAAIRIKFGHNWDAGWSFRRSFLQVKENEEKFPSFKPNAMLGGAMQVAAGTIPDGYKWLSNLLGIKGSIGGGMKRLEDFIAADDPLARLFRDEAIFYYLYLQFYIENKKAAVFEFIRQNQLDLKNNHLFTYLAANLSVNAQRSEAAEQILNQKNIDPAYFQTPVWDFELGTARLNHLAPDANIYLEKFVNAFKGNFYLKDVLQKLSWYYYLSGDLQKANAYRQMIIQKGSTDTEADKQALKEAKSNAWSDPLLLKARLLDDGGYFEEALQVLNGKHSSDFHSPEDRLEFAYRLARIYDDLNRDDEAIATYLTAIKLGATSKTYYAARSAWQIGTIYEQRGEWDRAISYYQKCLDLKDHDYKNSLDQKAKAGIARCKKE